MTKYISFKGLIELIRIYVQHELALPATQPIAMDIPQIPNVSINRIQKRAHGIQETIRVPSQLAAESENRNHKENANDVIDENSSVSAA